jgi:hypothetical protein
MKYSIQYGGKTFYQHLEEINQCSFIANQESHLVVKFPIESVYSFYITTDLITPNIGTFEQGGSDDSQEHSKAVSLRGFFNVFRYICDTKLTSKTSYNIGLFIFRGSSAKKHLERIIKYIKFIHPNFIEVKTNPISNCNAKNKPPQLINEFEVIIGINDSSMNFKFSVWCGYHKLLETLDDKFLEPFDFILGMGVAGRNKEPSGILVIPEYDQTYFNSKDSFTKLNFTLKEKNRNVLYKEYNLFVNKCIEYNRTNFYHGLNGINMENFSEINEKNCELVKLTNSLIYDPKYYAPKLLLTLVKEGDIFKPQDIFQNDVHIN